jgi:hypothetical protein
LWAATPCNFVDRHKRFGGHSPSTFRLEEQVAGLNWGTGKEIKELGLEKKQ